MGLEKTPTPQPAFVTHAMGTLMSPFCPAAPPSSSAVQAGGRKIGNAPSVSSQDSPLAKERKDMTQ